MSTLSVATAPQKRRRFSRAFKARIVASCQQPGVSVSRIALDHSLNANMVRRWMREAERSGADHVAEFVPLRLPATAAEKTPAVSGHPIRIEIPCPGGSMVVEWPADQADQCLTLLRSLMR